MKRTALLAVLLVAYGGVFGRFLVSGTGDAFDPVAPAAREIERALAEKQYDRALPLANELQTLHPNEPLVELWLALTYHGLHRFADEAKAWERFMEIGSAAEEACPWIAFANELANSGKPDVGIGALERCTTIDRRDPERLVDLGVALALSGKTEDALAVYRRAAEIDPRHPVIARQIERLSQAPAGAPR